MKKGKAIPILQIVKDDKTVTSLNSLTDDITILWLMIMLIYKLLLKVNLLK